jgi:predicted AAA+ superfamily ATPase
MFHRILNPLNSKSFFLFGARATGKSTFVRDRYGLEALYLDMLDPVLEDRLARHPGDLTLLVKGAARDWIIIDEVQKVPRLLDVVHQLLSTTKVKFVLTGSSARKLKRGGANLLAGRAYVYYMHPLTANELGDRFALEEVLQFGSLPGVLDVDSDREKKTFLQSYALTYMKEEIAAEQILRKIDPFRNFLRIAAEQSGRLVNHSHIAKQLGVDHKTVVNYFSILEDTLLGFYLPSFHVSIRKSQVAAPKFYLFDLGIRNSLAETIELRAAPRTSYFGVLFEHFLILECFRLNSYAETNYRMSFLLTRAGFEVDLILSKGARNTFIEIKSSDRIDPDEVAALARNLADDEAAHEIVYVSRDENQVEIDGVRCLPWRAFLRRYFTSIDVEPMS